MKLTVKLPAVMVGTGASYGAHYLGRLLFRTIERAAVGDSLLSSSADGLITVAKLWEVSTSCTVEVDDGRVFCSVYMDGANVRFKWRAGRRRSAGTQWRRTASLASGRYSP